MEKNELTIIIEGPELKSKLYEIAKPMREKKMERSVALIIILKRFFEKKPAM